MYISQTTVLKTCHHDDFTLGCERVEKIEIKEKNAAWKDIHVFQSDMLHQFLLFAADAK